MSPLRVLVVGGGAREHALAWKLAQSPRVKEIYAAPGNAGTTRLAHNLDISSADTAALIKAVRDHKIDFTVVGPEQPLAGGLVDELVVRGMPAFGPTRQAAEIESSKTFAKELMRKYHIPCAGGESFTDIEKARQYVLSRKPPVVIKADGLAAGKGVVIAGTTAEALEAVNRFMQEKVLGDAGRKVVVEELLAGREMSVFAFTDAHHVSPAEPACDYKRIYDGDRGPNTGGMGAYSPPRFAGPELARTIMDGIMRPAVAAMHQEGRPFKGVLYGGLMIADRAPKVLEFNARFGDPETQVIMPRLKTDLIDVMEAVVNNRLDQINVEWSDEACVGVVMASAGYPGPYRTGLPVTGLDEVDRDVLVFHGGTETGKTPGEILTAGGRVLTVAAAGQTIEEARRKVYANLPRIRFEGCYYRKDIAQIGKSEG